ncbi:MAG: hypothetical protein M3P51_05960, partial [Chloroflexota bacterium]|nr:hypothetical protein [Chloroflexota bacterium]
PLTWLMALALLLGACSTGPTRESRATPSAADPVLAQATHGTSHTPTTTTQPTVVPTDIPTMDPTPAPTSTEAPLPMPTEDALAEGPPEDGESEPVLAEFDLQVQDALDALEELHAYTYTASTQVFTGGYAAGFALRATISGPDRREWVLHEQEAPDHVLARWILIGNQAYSDISGRWRKISSVPFDTSSPISFATEYTNLLFESYGTDAFVQKSEAFISSEEATLYHLQRKVGHMAYDEELAGRSNGDMLYVAKEGGYLLGYVRPLFPDDPDGPILTINVTPLAKKPEMAPPTLGAPAFKGAPPPWRVFLLGHERLAELRSYRFSRAIDDYGAEIRVEGQVGQNQGRLSGAVPDEYAEPPPTPEEVEMANLDLVYLGSKVWARNDRGPWYRTTTNITRGQEPDYNALSLLYKVPGGMDEDVVGSRSEFDSFFFPTLFGVYGRYDAQVLSGGRLVGREVVNGVRTLHYEGAVNGGVYEPGDPAAQVWLAVDGLYLVRAQVTYGVEPGAPLGVRNETRLDVYDANKPFTVKSPAP